MLHWHKAKNGPERAAVIDAGDQTYSYYYGKEDLVDIELANLKSGATNSIYATGDTSSDRAVSRVNNAKSEHTAAINAAKANISTTY